MLSKQGKNKDKDWYNEECDKISDQMRQNMLTDNTDDNIKEYQGKKRRENKENELKDIDGKFKNKEIRALYQ